MAFVRCGASTARTVCARPLTRSSASTKHDRPTRHNPCGWRTRHNANPEERTRLELVVARRL
jgi:hypothetical protein